MIVKSRECSEYSSVMLSVYQREGVLYDDPFKVLDLTGVGVMIHVAISSIR
jgi:hypothetical protein